MVTVSVPAFASPSCLSDLELFLGSRANDKAPTAAAAIKLSLESPSFEVVDQIEKGAEYSYVVGPDGEVRFVPGKLDLPDNQLTLAVDAHDLGDQFPIHEAGRVTFNPETKIAELVPTYKPVDLTPQEVESLERSLTEYLGEARASRVRVKTDRATFVKCSQIRAAQKSGKSFVWDKFLTDNALFAVSVDPHRYVDRENYDSLLADWVTGQEHTFVKSVSSKYMVLSRMSVLKRLGVKTGIGLGSGQLQKLTYAAILRDKGNTNSSERAQNITEFNYIWLGPSLIKADALDVMVLRKLPDWSYNFCLRGSSLGLIMSPKVVRFVEGWASSKLYYKLRGMYLGEDGDGSK